MRKAKFRAWDEEMNQMYCGDQIESESNLNAWLSYGEIAIYRIDNGDYTELKPLQYTGLKDKNGMEIFEGDIVEAFHGTQISVVGWNDQYGLFEIALKVNGESEVSGELLGNHLYVIEVVGNVYEYPHLLKQEDPS